MTEGFSYAKEKERLLKELGIVLSSDEKARLFSIGNNEIRVDNFAHDFICKPLRSLHPKLI